MSNRSCEDCKWDIKGECKQGHVRWNRDKRWIINDCHAWGEKEIIACKLINPQAQCKDWDVKIQKGWCKDCVNHIVMPVLKEKCWCQMLGERRIQLHDYDFGVYSMRRPEIPKFCPICGQKIERLEKVKLDA